MSSKSESQTVYFKTNVLLKSILGKDLITEDTVAVLELVKNSFDALSKEVNIIFCNIKTNDDIIDLEKLSSQPVGQEGKNPSKYSSKILIQDFGTGMTEKEVKEKWLNIAFSEKKNQKEAGGRTLAGNKGVGRFSCDRLGRFLNIYTKVKGADNFTQLKIDWADFEVEDESDLQIQDIKLTLYEVSDNSFEKLTGLESFENGTVLEISHLRRKWGNEKLSKLRKDLEKLLNPNQAFKKDSFKVNIIAKEFSRALNGEIENKVFSKLDFKSTSIISELKDNGTIIETTLQDKGRTIFKLTEKNSSFDLLKNCKVKVVLYYLNPYAKGYFKRQSGYRSVDFGSVFLFINGFRIPPYGDEGDDWLNLERRKGQGYSRNLGTREILGRVEVLDEKGVYQVISNRTGVVNSEAFLQLVRIKTPHSFFYRAFRRLERFVVEGISWDSVPKNMEKHIAKLTENKSWKEEDEVYKRKQKDRDLNAFKSIIKILNIKDEELIDLEVNTGFIEEIADQQIESLENILRKSLEKVNKEGIKSDEVKNILNEIKTKNSELSGLIDGIQSVSKSTSVNKLTAKSKEFENTAKEFEQIFNDLKKAEEELKKAEEEQKRIEEELRLEKEKNTYLLASDRGLSHDAKGLIHNIKITSKNIRSISDQLIEKLSHGEFSTDYLIKKISVIKYNSDKALKITQLVTRANFKTQAEKQKIDLPKFINQYLSIYSDIFEEDRLKIILEEIDDLSFLTRKSILDTSLIFDDLISNSQKAGAKNIFFKFISKEDFFIVEVHDDGDGLHESFVENPEKIFELGITTTDGSGIGLNFVKETLKKQGAIIKYMGKSERGGASFRLTFKR